MAFEELKARFGEGKVEEWQKACDEANNWKPHPPILMPQYERIIEHRRFRFPLRSRLRHCITDNDVAIVKDIIDYLGAMDDLPYIILDAYIDDRNRGDINFTVINEEGMSCPSDIHDLEKVTSHLPEECGQVAAYFSGYAFELPDDRYDKNSDWYSRTDALATEYDTFRKLIEAFPPEEARELDSRHSIG